LLSGLPRRIPDFPDAYAGWNLISSYGSLLSVFSSIIFLIITIDLFVAKRPYLTTGTIGSFFGSNESSQTLEFILSNPPAFHSFNQLPY
jgi:heme/copper-type cytochrome/quinol oxidase subunit 1